MYRIATGGGWRSKRRLELGVLPDGRADATRSSQGPSLGIGVPSDSSSLDADLCYLRTEHRWGRRAIFQKRVNLGGRVRFYFAAHSAGMGTWQDANA